MGIIINLDVVMAQRKKGLTELSKEVDITMANLSILKNNKAKAIRFLHWKQYVRLLIVNREILLSMFLMKKSDIEKERIV